jgi:hypothetical protein
VPPSWRNRVSLCRPHHRPVAVRPVDDVVTINPQMQVETIRSRRPAAVRRGWAITLTGCGGPPRRGCMRVTVPSGRRRSWRARTIVGCVARGAPATA